MTSNFSFVTVAGFLLSFHGELFCSNAIRDHDFSAVQESLFRCTTHANDHGTCLRLSHCSWCQGEGVPGICVSEQQAKALMHKIPHVKCWTKEGIPEAEPIAPYDPICLNAPSTTGPDDEPADICDATTDSMGARCVWCDAAGVFDLCLSHEQAREAYSYLQCDLRDLQ